MSGPTQIMVTQWQGVDALARDRKDGIAHRRRNCRDTRFADATPFVPPLSARCVLTSGMAWMRSIW
jgi:hypothetical protein